MRLYPERSVQSSPLPHPPPLSNRNLHPVELLPMPGNYFFPYLSISAYAEVQQYCSFISVIKKGKVRICNFFQRHNSFYNLRKGDFSESRFNTVAQVKHSLRYLGLKLWNNLCIAIEDNTSRKKCGEFTRKMDPTSPEDDNNCDGFMLCST